MKKTFFYKLKKEYISFNFTELNPQKSSVNKKELN
jgi:hypothetical protein